MTALLDDHLLRDLLAGAVVDEMQAELEEHPAATTNLYLYRLSRSVVSSRGGPLTGRWTPEQRRELGRNLLTAPDDAVRIVPMRVLAYRMAEIASAHGVSTLGAETAAAAEYLRATVYVWEGDDGPRIREAVEAVGAPYRTIAR